MALPTALNDREHQKFIDIAPGETAVRVSGENFSGNFSITGLKVGGKVTEVTVNDFEWTALPLVPLAERNALAIQNTSGQSVKINYTNSVSGFVGMLIPDGGERFYDIKDDIVLFGKSSSGTAVLNIEEIA
jgi:hypothetical protein